MGIQTFTCNSCSEVKEKRKYETVSVSCVAFEGFEVLADSVHKKATVRSIGQEVVTIDDFSDSGEFDTTWEKVDF